jgi:hypothetical protein
VGLSQAIGEPKPVEAEVREVLDAAAGIDAAPWIYNEFTGADLGDERLNKRLVMTAGFLGASPVAPINQACLDWRGIKGAYRFFDNNRADAAKIRAPHIAAAGQRMIAATDGGQKVLLAASDTAFIAYKHPVVTGIGPIGKDNKDGLGLVMHSVLVMTTEGTPLGVLHQNIWARDEVPEETHQEKIERLQQTPIEEKESWKWEKASEDLRQHTPRGVKVVELDDREGDFYEHLVGQERRKSWYVIRARVDRLLVEEDNDGHARMREVLEAAEVLGTMVVQIQGNDDRKTRTATVEIKAEAVTIPQPQRRGRAKDPTLPDEITVRLVSATEISTPPAGEETISWVLLTNMQVPNFDAAREKVLWYSKRFVIETFHKVLKSGLKVEDCRLETATRLTRHLAVCSIIAVRMMNVAYLSRESPDLSADKVFAKQELDALHVQLREGPPPRRAPSLKEAVRMVVKLGGNPDRRRDKPGMTVMWRGWRKMYGAVRLMRRLQMAGMLKSA